MRKQLALSPNVIWEENVANALQDGYKKIVGIWSAITTFLIAVATRFLINPLSRGLIYIAHHLNQFPIVQRFKTWRKNRAIKRAGQPKHPPGLFVLFFAEMWERFGFYLMLALFVLFLNEQMGIPEEVAAKEYYGRYMAAVYFTPLIGGWLADRYGHQRCVKIGACLLALGYFLLAYFVYTVEFQGNRNENFMYFSLLILCFGNGLFKPNISTLVGKLYPQGGAIRDAAFAIFYVGINLGALGSPVAASEIRLAYGWAAAFSMAGFGMMASYLTLYFGRKYLTITEEKSSAAAAIEQVTGIQLNAEAKQDVAFVDKPEPWSVVKPRILALLTVCSTIIVFNMAFHQNGSTLTLSARDNTFRAWLKTEKNNESRAQIVSYEILPPAKTGMRPSKARITIDRLPADLASLASIAVNDRLDVSVAIPLGDGLDLTTADAKSIDMKHNSFVVTPLFHKVPAPGTALYTKSAYREITTEKFNTLNPIFVFMFTPVLVFFFAFMKRRNYEVSTPAKLAWGMTLTGVAFLTMGIAGSLGANTGRVNLLWITMANLIVTNGELLLQPIGLSLVTKLAPKHMTSLMMGVWFASMSIGNWLSGTFGGLWKTWNHSSFFYLLGACCFGAAIFLATRLSRLRLVMPNETTPEDNQRGNPRLEQPPPLPHPAQH